MRVFPTLAAAFFFLAGLFILGSSAILLGFGGADFMGKPGYVLAGLVLFSLGYKTLWHSLKSLKRAGS